MISARILTDNMKRLLSTVKLEGTGIWVDVCTTYCTETAAVGYAVYRGEIFADLSLTGNTLKVEARNRYNLYDRSITASFEVADDGKVSLHRDRELEFLAPHFEAKYQSRKASHLPSLIPLTSNLTDVLLHVFRVVNPNLTFQG
jgi:hypothetical protein